MTDDLTLSLTWRHGRGMLAAFLAGLEQGRIPGAHCPTCGRTVAPPRFLCSVDGTTMAPVDLPPTGTVLQVTTGAASSLAGTGTGDQTFALVQVTGADNSLLARIAAHPGQVAAGSAVRLSRGGRNVAHPIQALVFEPFG